LPDVVGESYHRAELQSLISRAPKDQQAAGEVFGDVTLVEDPTNEFDDQAIGVYFQGTLVGHIGRDSTGEIHDVIDAVGSQGYNATQVGCKGVIGWSGDADMLTVINLPIGVRLDLQRSEEE
jgi:hypothetical protein